MQAVAYRDKIVRILTCIKGKDIEKFYLPYQRDYGANPQQVIPQLVERAEIVIWSRAMWAAATRGHEEFADCNAQFPPLSAPGIHIQLWIPGDSPSFQEPDCGPDKSFGGKWMAELSYIGTGKHGKRWLDFWGIEGDENGLLYMRQMLTIPEGGFKDTADKIISYFTFRVAARAFMEERVCATRAEPLPRQYRRKYERDNSFAPSVKTVVLRRELEESEPRASTDESGRNYSCQWFVSGGWQNRRIGPRDEPEKQSLRPVYVDTYVKGPADKPLRVPAATVMRVSR